MITLRLEALSDALLDHVVTHAATAMPGRTHGQHAQPVTFGYKAAVWLDEVRRHQTRMDEMRPRLLVGQFGGAVGTLAALGDQGLAVREKLMAKLELGEPQNYMAHSSRSSGGIDFQYGNDRGDMWQDRTRDLYPTKNRNPRSRRTLPRWQGRIINYAAQTQPRHLRRDHGAIAHCPFIITTGV